jgi:hypothetical protein
MAYDQHRVNTIVKEQRANHPYLQEALASQVIGWIMNNRDKRVSVMTDIARALQKFQIPQLQSVGYRFVGAEYFNQRKRIDRYGKLIPKRSKK